MASEGDVRSSVILHYTSYLAVFLIAMQIVKQPFGSQYVV